MFDFLFGRQRRELEEWGRILDEHTARFPLGAKVDYLGREMTIVSTSRWHWNGDFSAHRLPELEVACFDDDGCYQQITVPRSMWDHLEVATETTGA